MWILINGFDASNIIDWDTSSRPLQFTQAQSDPNSKADLHIADPGSLLSFTTGQEVIIWDESTPPEPVNVAATPSHNLLFDYAFNNTTDWVAVGLSIISRSIGSFFLTFANSATTLTALSQTTLYGYVHPGQQYMIAGYITGSGTISHILWVLQLQFLDAAGNNLGSVVSVSGTPTLSQQHVNLSAVAPAGAVYVRASLGGAATVNGNNSGVITWATPQLEGMWFVAQGVSYPTNDINNGQVDCTTMPDGTISRTARIFSGYIDNLIKTYDGPNRLWQLSLASAGDTLEKGANNLINYSATNRFDDLIISDLVTTYYPGALSITQANNFAPNPVVRGVSIASVAWNDMSLRDLMNGLCDQSGYTYRVNEYYTLEYHPQVYNAATFTVVAAVSADGISTIAPEDYSIESDITQQKQAVKVIGAPYTAPFFTDKFNGTGSQTQFTLTQIPHEVRNISVGGVQQVAGINGVNQLGDVISAGTIVVLVDQAGHFMLFQTAPGVGTNNVTCEYDYKGPVAIQVLAQVAQPIAPAYASPLFWVKVHDTSITSLAAATERGLQELTRFVNPRTVLKFKTFKWVPPGVVIYFTSAQDGLAAQPYQVQKVTGRLLGSGLNQYEVECGDYVADLTSFMRLNHRAHQRSTYTANTTTPQQTDVVWIETLAYSETVTIAVKTANTSTYGTGVYGTNTWG